MRQIKIGQITALWLAANVMALAGLLNVSFTARATGEVRGTVIDMNDARVSRATITVEGDGLSRTVATSDDGTYKIELPLGTYRIKATRIGFFPGRRAPFRAVSSASIILNFTLIPCSIVNEITIKSGQYVGEKDRYEDPFKEEVFPLVHPTGTQLELSVRYGSRQEDQNIVEYRGTVIPYEAHADTPTGSVRRDKYLGVTISYNLLTIRADQVRLDPTTFRLEAEGNVVVEDGKRCDKGRRVVADLKTDEPRVELIQ
jgi:hypothetical protein